MTEKARRGVYAAVLTPIGEDGQPEREKFVDYSRQLLAEGLDGLAPLGTTGEANSLPFAFRLSVADAYAKAGIPSDRVIFGTGSPSLADAIELTRSVLRAGYTNVLVLPPFYFKNVAEEGLYTFYARLADGVDDPRLRVYLYHFPQMTQVPISRELIVRLKARFGSVMAGLKDSSGDFEGSKAFMETADDFDVFPSNEGVLVETLERKGGGVISATTNATGRITRRLLDAAGEERQALQELAHAARQIISGYSLSAALKQIEAWRSGDDGWRRVLPPLLELDDTQAPELRRKLETLDGAGILDGH